MNMNMYLLMTDVLPFRFDSSVIVPLLGSSKLKLSRVVIGLDVSSLVS